MPDTLLALLLARLDQVEDPVLLHRKAAAYPAEELEALLSAGIMKETSQAHQVPRPAHMPAGEDLLVRETARGLFGVAGEDDYHEPVPLAEDDVRQYEIVVSKLVDLLRQENGLEGAPVQNGRRLTLVGERPLPGGQRADVYLSLLNDDQSEFMLLCQHVHPASPRPVVMLVPTSVPLSVENVHLLRSWDVFVSPLTTYLNGPDWKLPWDRLLENAGDPERKEGVGPQDVYCRVITRQEARLLGRAQYEELVRETDGYDMFIDGMRRVASCRDAKGTPWSAKLTPKEFGILSDFIQTPKPVRAWSTKTGETCPTSEAARRLFEQARRKTDVKLGRYNYRAFRLHKNSHDAKLTSYEFAPPEDLMYCLILPA